jgi:putative ABC transport system substrate-binding protein
VSQYRRRQFVIAAGALLAAPLLRAQQTGRSYRVALVLTTSPIAEMAGPDPAHPVTRAVLHELRALGYVEGRNLIFERRSAEGKPARYGEIIDELIRLKTDAIIPASDPALIRAAQAATRTIPIVLLGYTAAVEDGFAASLARPGGNVTGLAEHPGAVFAGKQLQLFKETLPGLSRVASLGPTANLDSAAARPFTDAAAALGIKLLRVLQHPTDPEASFAAIAKLRVDGLIVSGSSTAFAQREQFGRLAFAARLPAISSYDRMAETGGLMSYGPANRFRRIAHYVDKILKGGNPGELPMELPTKFNLVVNLKTAKALGLKIPPSIMLQADRVIE